MLSGIVIGMNALGASQSISKGEYVWAAVQLGIVLVVYFCETRKK